MTSFVTSELNAFVDRMIPNTAKHTTRCGVSITRGRNENEKQQQQKQSMKIKLTKEQTLHLENKKLRRIAADLLLGMKAITKITSRAGAIAIAHKALDHAFDQYENLKP